MTVVGLAILGCIVFVAFAAHSVTGFGSMILSIALGAQLFEIGEILPPLLVASVVLNATIIAGSRLSVDRRLLVRWILPWMGASAVVGFLVAGAIGGDLLRRAFGVMVVALVLRELWQLWRRRGAEEPPRRPSPPVGWLIGAGIIHGIYATGGPPLVYALSRTAMDKSSFRATLCVVWLVLNLGMITGFAVSGRFLVSHAPAAVVCTATALVAVAVGSAVHQRVDEKRFRVAIYLLLLVAASGLIWR